MAGSINPATFGTNSFLPALGGTSTTSKYDDPVHHTLQRRFPKQIFSGKSMDQVYGQNMVDLARLREENKDLKNELS